MIHAGHIYARPIETWATILTVAATAVAGDVLTAGAMRRIGDLDRMAERTPTFAVTFDAVSPAEAAVALAGEGIFTWDGHFYAQGLIERLGRAEGEHDGLAAVRQLDALGADRPILLAYHPVARMNPFQALLYRACSPATFRQFLVSRDNSWSLPLSPV